MELRYEGYIDLKSDADFAKFLNPELVGKAFPGVASITKDGDWYRARMTIGIGGLRGPMDVKFRYAEASENKVVVVGSASGLQSTVDFTLQLIKEGVRAHWVFVGNARGLISALGKPIVDAAAKSIVDQVVRNLQSL
ncbi:MAG: CoxG family protein [Thermoproteus sp. AZ2]|jgi:carbon monoxide dehydrogenase subunit G|uniref:CoxG family protein n=1 Tax=Thermoproteus sp. AZ2 TaxID=1609232 RepID=A0ACC6V045_9CREN|nr:MAG: carbon monoxide dehydrogenase [Thermoproteus sp. AZ2]